MSGAALHAFAGYGVELEYMIVDKQTLSVLPIADALLREASASPAYVNEVKRDRFAWSNELVLHLVEIKNWQPVPQLAPLPAGFQAEIGYINRLLVPMGARLMPGAMHPWLDPRTETRLWPHGNAGIYQAYDRIFDCKNGHGWANLQSMHINLPFADDAEFTRLHAAARLILPIIPAMAASSPIAEGRFAGWMDFRMEAYRTNALRIPASTGKVIPQTITSRAKYESQILAPMYRDIAALDPEGVLQHEWLNSRGAIPRFDRNAIEIRVTDMQECPQADLAIAAAVVAAVRTLYDATTATLRAQQQISTDALVKILHACMHDAEQALIDDAAYLQILGFPDNRCEARALWQHLVEPMSDDDHWNVWQEPLRVILEQGPLARRILHAVGARCDQSHLEAVYRELCDCLGEGRMFHG